MLLNYATSATQAASAAPTPIRNVEILPNGDIKVTYTFSSAMLTTTSVSGKTCYVWSISGFGQNTSSTEAALPRRIDSFQIPEGKTATVSLLSSSYKSFCYNMAAGSSPRNEGSTMTERARPVPSSSVPLPANVVSMANIQSYRGVNIANVMVCPAQYISSSTTIRAYTTISYLVHFSESASTVSKKNDKERDLMYFTMDYLIHNGTTEDIKVAPSSGGGGGGVSGNGEFNPGDPIHTTTNLSTGPVDADLTYVILTTDALKSSTVNFAKWKKMQGYNVVTLSAPSWTHDSAKSAVRALYNQYPDFYHLLIVGGANDVPGYNPVGTVGALIIDRYPSDYPFSLKEDNDDALPDITVGRIPLSNSEEITDALYKIRRYEEQPTQSIVSSDAHVVARFYENPSHSGYEDRRFVKTSEEIFDYLKNHSNLNPQRIYAAAASISPTNWCLPRLSFGEPLPDYLKRPNFAWNGSASDISSGITSGSGLMVYRGYGDITNWNGFSFTNENVSALNNRKLPIVFSIACSTGAYDATNNIVVELIKGRLKGSPCIIAPTGKIYEGVSDEFTSALIDARWPNPGLMPTFAVSTGQTTKVLIPVSTIGGMFLQAIKRTGERFNETWVYEADELKKAMHIFGDPSMLVYTEAVANASSVATVTRSDNKKQTNGDFTSLPMISVRSDKNVFIGMYNNATGETKRYYGSFLNYYPSTTDKWDVTVYEANLRPLISYYEGITIVFPSLNGVSYDSSNNICTTSVDTEECDDENYEIEVRDSFGTVVGRTEGSGSGIQKIPVTSNKDGVHIVSLLYDGAIVESKHFLK